METEKLTLLNEKQVKSKIKKNIKDIFELNENENTT